LPAPACLAHSAVVSYAPAVPGMIQTIYGSNLGPNAGVSFQLDSNGNVPAQLAGTAVTVGGLPAPILYTRENQINFIVPQEITGPSTNVCVITAAGQNCIYALVAALDPAIYSIPNQGYAILNQDGTLNSSSNPALPGSVISLFGTGMGPYNRPLADGSVAGLPLANLTTPLGAEFLDPNPPICPIPGATCGPPPDNTEGTVLFAGAAPGEVVGVTQVNVLIPANVVPGNSITLQLILEPPGSNIVAANVTVAIQ
jgi:uncharacterized protein (TIGR03437 family)